MIKSTANNFRTWARLSCTLQQSRSVHQRMDFSSAAPIENRSVKIESFRTTESDPRNHDLNHLSRFYRIDDAVNDRLFKYSLIFGLSTKELFNICDETCFMVRKPALELINYIRNTNYDRPVVRYVIWGKHGQGKTFTLAHVLNYAYNEQFLIVNAGSEANKWMNTPQEVCASESRKGRFDLPLDSALWLQQFKALNASLLAKLDLKVSKKYTWSLREHTEEGESVMNIIDHGIARIKHASDCVAVLLKELKMAANEGKGFKLFVGVDIANAFYRRTHIRHEDKTEVEADEVTIARAFMKLFNNDWKNGVVVITVDSKPLIKKEWIHFDGTGWQFKDEVPYPKSLLREEGFKVFDPFVPIEVPKYSEEEIESALDYYTDRKLLLRGPSLTKEGRAELKFLSCYNPKELYQLARAR